METVVFENFAGGANYGDPEKIAVNEAAVLEHFVHTDGNLRSFEGRVLLNATEIEGSGSIGDLSRVTLGNTTRTLAMTAQKPLLDCGAGLTPQFRPIMDYGVADSNMSQVPWGSSLYILPPATPMLRWDNFAYFTGTASVTLDGTNVVGTGTSWDTANIRKGDTIYFYSSGAWTDGRYITLVTDATHLSTAVGGAAMVDVPYMISRGHYAGIDAPGGTITATPSGAGTGSIPAGNYLFAVTLRNSQTGYESNPSYISGTVVCAADDKVVIAAFTTAYNTWESRLQADQMRIYRTTAGGGVYYLALTASRDQADYAFATSYTVTGADSTLGAAIEVNHEMPPGGAGQLLRWNSRLLAVDVCSQWASAGSYTALSANNRIMVSTTNRPEYWPLFELGVVDVTTVNRLLGGFMDVGDPGRTLMQAVPEQGTTAAEGTRGENLLLVKESGLFYRLFGRDWTEFNLQEAFSSSCVSRQTIFNANGVLVWVSDSGPMALTPGSNHPVSVYQKLFPQASRRFSDLVTSGSKSLCVGVVWNDWYIVAWPETPSTTNNRAFCLHLPTGTFFTLDGSTNPLAAASFTRWDGPSDMNKLYYGQAGAAYVWELFAKTGSNTYWTPASSAGVACKFVSQMVTGGPPQLATEKHIKEVLVCFQRPAANQTVTMTVLVDGMTTGTGRDLTLLTAGSKGRAWVKYLNCNEQADSCFQIQITGTFTVPVVLERIIVKYTLHGQHR